VSLPRLLQEQEGEGDEVLEEDVPAEGRAGLGITFLAAWMIKGLLSFISSRTTLGVMCWKLCNDSKEVKQVLAPYSYIFIFE
jgi:hypothetical protein